MMIVLGDKNMQRTKFLLVFRHYMLLVMATVCLIRQVFFSLEAKATLCIYVCLQSFMQLIILIIT